MRRIFLLGLLVCCWASSAIAQSTVKEIVIQQPAKNGGSPGGTAGGDLSGTYPNPTVAKVNGTTAGTAANVNTGTSGATVPLLNGSNTASGPWLFDGVACPSVSSSGIVLGPDANRSMGFVDSSASTNNHIAVYSWTGGTFYGRFLSDNCGSATDWLHVNGGQAAGITSVTFPAGYLGPQGVVSLGTKFTITGCTAGTTNGGATAGTFVSGTTGTCTVVITMNGATGLTAPNGWSCWVNDETTANLMRQTASSTTTATVSGTTIANDAIIFGCMGF